jgi:hypothetical protein
VLRAVEENERTSPTMSVILREVERLVSDLIELSMRHNLAYWGTMGAVPRGWARSASGDTAQGIAWIEKGIAYYRGTGSVLVMCYFLRRIPSQKSGRVRKTWIPTTSLLTALAWCKATRRAISGRVN